MPLIRQSTYQTIQNKNVMSLYSPDKRKDKRTSTLAMKKTIICSFAFTIMSLLLNTDRSVLFMNRFMFICSGVLQIQRSPDVEKFTTLRKMLLNNSTVAQPNADPGSK